MSPHSRIESLEDRIAPAAIVTPATFTYTDGNGDQVQVQISGKTGSAEFLDSGGGDVKTSGGDIAKIIIKKPSPDFAISFSDLNSAIGLNVGDNIIDLGIITGLNNTRLPVIKGIFTADSTPSVSYHLAGYVGKNFSAGGGLSIVGELVGDGVGATADIDLSGLSKLASVHVTKINGSATAQIGGITAGNFRTDTLNGNLSMAMVSGFVQVGDIAGDLTIQRDLSGRLIVGSAPGATSEEVTIKGSVVKPGAIYAPHDLTLHVTKNLSGAVSTGGSLDADVSGAILGATIGSADDISLTVTGIVGNSSIIAQHLVTSGTAFKRGMKSSSVEGGTGLNLNITGGMAKSHVSAGTGNLNVDISGKVAGSQLLAGGDADVTTGFTVEQSTIVPDGRLTLTVGTPGQGLPGVGNVIQSTIGSGSTSATVNIGGKVVGSKFTSGTDLELNIEKSMSGSTAQSSNDLKFTAGTNVQGSKFTVGSDADITVGGQLASSTFLIGNDFDAEIGQTGQPVSVGGIISAGVVGTKIETSDGSVDVKVVGPVSGSSFTSGLNADLTVSDLTGVDPITHNLKLLRAGNVNALVQIAAPGDVTVKSTGVGSESPQIVSGHDISVDVAGRFGGSARATNNVSLHAKAVAMTKVDGLRVGGNLSLVVTGGFTAPAVDVEGDVTDFRVGGALSSGINVGGNFISGTTGASSTVVGGVVAKSAFLHIGGNLGGNLSAPELVFSKGFAGRLEVVGDILSDLTFQGNVNRISVGGQVGPAVGVGDAVADIIVKGKLVSFTSSSLFHRTSASDGNFVNAANIMTGALHADSGAPNVGPFLV